MPGSNYQTPLYLPSSPVTSNIGASQGSYGYRFLSPHRGNMPEAYNSSGGIEPWSNVWTPTTIMGTTGSGDRFCLQNEISPFVDAVTERMLALNWFDPISGVAISPHQVSLYFLPQSGDLALWTNNANPYGGLQAPNNDFGWNYPMIQQIVWDMAGCFAQTSGSPDTLIYPNYWASGYYAYGTVNPQTVFVSGVAPTEILFPWYNDINGNWQYGTSSPYAEYPSDFATLGTVPIQYYGYRTERPISYTISTLGGPQILSNDPLHQDGSGVSPWPPPSGFSRIFPREIFQIPSSGSLGQIARFTVLQNHSFGPRNQLTSGMETTFTMADPILQSYGGYTTPSDQQHLAGQMMYYSSSGWIVYSQAGLGPPPFNPDFIQDFGLIQYGDYMGPWILNDLKVGINRLQRVVGMNAAGAFYHHPLYSYATWTCSGQYNSEGIFIPDNPFTNDPTSSRFGPGPDLWRLFTNPTELASAWAGMSGMIYNFNYGLPLNFVSESNDSYVTNTGSGSYNDVFYTETNGFYASGTGGTTPDYWDSQLNNPPTGAPTSYVGTFYWRGYKAKDDYSLDSLFPSFENGSAYNNMFVGNSQANAPFAGVGYSSTEDNNGFGLPGNYVGARSAYLMTSGFLPGRQPYIDCYAYGDMNGASGYNNLPFSGVYSSVSNSPCLYNDLGTGLKWRQWNRFCSGLVTPANTTYLTSKLGSISTPPSNTIDPLSIWPSGSSSSNFYYISEGYQVDDIALVVDYQQPSGFLYQSVASGCNYISPSGWLLNR